MLDTATVPFRTLPVGFPLPTFSWSFLNVTFVPFDSYPRLDSILPLRASKFSDLKLCSVSLFIPLSSISDREASLSFDESPDGTIQILF